MRKKGNISILIGVFLVLIGTVGYYWSYYKTHHPSPFDVVDEEISQEEYIPIILPVDPDEGEIAPTLDSPPREEYYDGGEQIGIIPERLVIPAIHLDAPIEPVHYRDLEVGGDTYHQWRVPLKYAVGWHDESALLGMPGNTVLNGHHNAYGMVFKDLVKIGVGDLIKVFSGEFEFQYEVAAKMLLPEVGESLETRLENARWMLPSEDERLTLLTCWPADSNTHRVVIVAYPISIK